MKSTGEVLGIGATREEAIFKALTAAGYRMTRVMPNGAAGGVFLSSDRVSDPGDEIAGVAKKYARLGFALYAEPGSGAAASLSHAGLPFAALSEEEAMRLLEGGGIGYVVSTLPGERALRSIAVRLGVPCLTSLDTASAVADALYSRYGELNTELVDVNRMRRQRKKLPFVKMHSCGKDDIYIDCLDPRGTGVPASPESLAVMLADRHDGVGSYGVALICPPSEGSPTADVRVRMFSMDGSEGLMSGSALACVGVYAHERGYALGSHGRLLVETWSGVREVEVLTRYGHAVAARVNLGRPRFDPASVPVLLDGDRVVGRTVSVPPLTVQMTCLSVGNPHCVVFRDDAETFDIGGVAPLLEQAPLFPKRTNVEFVRVLDASTLRMRIWERGDGETPASGAGSCAAVVAAVENGLCSPGRIRVLQPGGEMFVEYDGGDVVLDCDVRIAFTGEVEI